MAYDTITVTSLQNRWVKYARSLMRRRSRYQERAFLVEGVRLCRDALNAGAVPRVLLFNAESTTPGVREVVATAAEAGARVIAASEAVIRAASDTETPQGIVAVFPFPEIQIEIPARTNLLAVIADGIRDPGNLGTLARSAAAAGAHALFISAETVDPFAPKVVRAGMGAHFRLPIRPLHWDDLDPLVAGCPQRLVAVPRAAQPYDEIDWTGPSCLVIGGEATGASPGALRSATGTVTIPLAPGVESLNAAIAGSVILFEAARQRRAQYLSPQRE